MLTLQVFLLFVWFCPQMHVCGVFLYLFSNVHVFIAFSGVCSCLRRRKNCERGFLNTVASQNCVVLLLPPPPRSWDLF